MPDQPFIFFPRPTNVPRKSLGGGGRPITKPTPAAQQQRLDQKFQQIADSFANVTTGVAGLQPEQVIVFETISAIDNVAKAAAEIPGMEWLAESDLAEGDPEFGFADEKEP